MDILINDNKINYTLEKENNLGDVVDGIRSWLSGYNFIVADLEVDALKIKEETDEQWQGRPLEDINQLAVTVWSYQDAQGDNLYTVLTYLTMLKNALSAKHTEYLKELQGGYPFMLESLEKAGINGTAVEELKNLQPAEVDLSDSTQLLRTLEQIDTVVKRVSHRLENMEKSPKNLTGIIEKLETVEEEVAGVSVLLQTGKDQEAMDRIIRFSDLCGDILSVLFQGHRSGKIDGFSVGNERIEAFFKNLNMVLSEIVEAFDCQDAVLIGDLLEYEVAPRLGLLAQALPELQKRMK